MTPTELLNQSRSAEPRPQPDDPNSRAALLNPDEQGRLGARWQQVEQGMVAEPRTAVRQAGELAATTIRRVTDIFRRADQTGGGVVARRRRAHRGSAPGPAPVPLVLRPHAERLSSAPGPPLPRPRLQASRKPIQASFPPDALSGRGRRRPVRFYRRKLAIVARKSRSLLEPLPRVSARTKRLFHPARSRSRPAASPFSKSRRGSSRLYPERTCSSR
jgi:hypothetical protein